MCKWHSATRKDSVCRDVEINEGGRSALGRRDLAKDIQDTVGGSEKRKGNLMSQEALVPRCL